MINFTIVVMVIFILIKLNKSREKCYIHDNKTIGTFEDTLIRTGGEIYVGIR